MLGYQSNKDACPPFRESEENGKRGKGSYDWNSSGSRRGLCGPGVARSSRIHERRNRSRLACGQMDVCFSHRQWWRSGGRQLGGRTPVRGCSRTCRGNQGWHHSYSSRNWGCCWCVQEGWTHQLLRSADEALSGCPSRAFTAEPQCNGTRFQERIEEHPPCCFSFDFGLALNSFLYVKYASQPPMC